MSNQSLTFRCHVPVSAEDLFAWHTRPAAFLRLQPPWERIQFLSQEGPFGNGHRVAFRTSMLGPLKTTWVAEVHDFIPGQQFCDRQVSGPFPFWDHTHRMIADGPDQSILEDHMEYRLPLGMPGQLVGSGLVRSRLEQVFAYRHAVTASDLRRLAPFRDRPRLKIGITGSRGLVGTELTHFLTTGGHQVVRFLRGKAEPTSFDDGTTSVSWDPEKPVDSRTLEGLDAVIHLAGENVAERRWNDVQKQRILNSRIGPTRRLAEAIALMERKPTVFITASGLSYYGNAQDNECDESAPMGQGFLADVTRQWEAATEPASAVGVRVAKMRIGVVLSPKGAALGKQLLPFKTGAGAVLGSGQQWVSWITINDLIGAFHHTLMTNAVAGPVNVVGPNPVSNREFGRILARILHRPYLFTLPGFALRLLFGEVTDEALLASMRVRPGKLLATGFEFDHPLLEAGLRFLLGRT